MVRLATRGKGLDDDHATAAARTRMRGGRRLVGTAVVVGQGLRFWHGEQLACSRKIFRAARLGQQSVVTNAMEAVRQDVDEEAADKLTCCERHDFAARLAVGTIILVVEGDAVVVERNQSAIGDGNTVGIARQIGEYRLGSAEWGFA